MGLFGTDMHVSIYNLSPWVSDCGNVSIQGTCICLFSFEEHTVTDIIWSIYFMLAEDLQHSHRISPCRHRFSIDG